MDKKLPLLITVTGMSGVGKDAVIQGLMKLDKHIKQYTSATTRDPRPGEINGEHYHFLTRDDFMNRLNKNEFLEHNANYHGNLYGTLKADVDAIWTDNCDAISDINTHGVFAFRKTIPSQHFALLIMPPSRERLYQRLTQRNPELAEDGKKRFKAAEADLAHMHDPHYVFTNPDMIGSTLNDYDAVFVNDDLEVTVYAVLKRIQEEREKRRMT